MASISCRIEKLKWWRKKTEEESTSKREKKKKIKRQPYEVSRKGMYLMNTKKLILLINLDQTILHSQKSIFRNSRYDINHFAIEGLNYHYKLRPTALKMLSNLTCIYDIYPFTRKKLEYVEKILFQIDFCRVLFSRNSIITSMGLEQNYQTVTRIFSKEIDMVIILDSQTIGWKNCGHIVTVHPFRFFFQPCGFDEEAETLRGQQVRLAIKGSRPTPGDETLPVLYCWEEMDTKLESEYLKRLFEHLRLIHKEFFNFYKQLGRAEIKTCIARVDAIHKL